MPTTNKWHKSAGQVEGAWRTRWELI